MFFSFLIVDLFANDSISLNVLPSHPALVANGIIVLFDRSYFVRNALMAGHGLYHQQLFLETCLKNIGVLLY